jgi:transcription initiation factor TFIIB
LKEVARQINIKKTNLAKMCKMVLMELDLKIPVLNPLSCIIRVGNKAGVSEKTMRLAVRVIKEMTKEKKAVGKNPMGVAATVLYVACLMSGEQTNQSIMANAAGVTEVTIRNRLRDLKGRAIVTQKIEG